MSKNSVPVDSFPETPTAHHPSSLHSTPSTTTMSPGLTPFTTPTASPHSATIAAFLAQANSSLQQSPQAVATGASLMCTTKVAPSGVTIANPVSGLSSPQAMTSLPSKHVLPVAKRSPVSAAKAVLHHRCPANQTECVSPLIKSSFANTDSPGNIQSSPVQGSPSLATSRSPSAKFVTVSILQQLQQNPNISKLLSAASVLQSNGNGTSA